MKSLTRTVLLLSTLLSVPVMAQTPDFAHLMTTGFGEVTAKPDMATFSVRVVESTLTAEQAKEAVDKTVDQFLAELTKAGVSKEQIQSSNLYLAPQYQYPKEGKPELVGYRASRTVEVQVNKLEHLNQYLDVALRAGINQVDNITLKVSNEAVYKDKARDAAIADAKAKAAALAKGFDSDLGKIWQINYDTPNRTPMLMRSATMDARQESNSYQDATIVIRDQVNVIYQLD